MVMCHHDSRSSWASSQSLPSTLCSAKLKFIPKIKVDFEDRLSVGIWGCHRLRTMVSSCCVEIVLATAWRRRSMHEPTSFPPEHFWSLLVAPFSQSTPPSFLDSWFDAGQPAEHVPVHHPEGLGHAEAEENEELRELLTNWALLFGDEPPLPPPPEGRAQASRLSLSDLEAVAQTTLCGLQHSCVRQSHSALQGWDQPSRQHSRGFKGDVREAMARKLMAGRLPLAPSAEYTALEVSDSRGQRRPPKASGCLRPHACRSLSSQI